MTETAVHYTIYKHRKDKNGKWRYYAHFYDPETGERLSARSTRKTSKREARIWLVQTKDRRRRLSPEKADYIS